MSGAVQTQIEPPMEGESTIAFPTLFRPEGRTRWQRNPVDLAEVARELDVGEIDRELAFRSFHEFVRLLWPTVEKSPFVDGWHIQAKCEHLQAVTSGQIKRLLINEPPRCSKSLICSVLWPAWEWLHLPSTRFLTASYAHVLSIRDSVRCRRLIQSPTYQAIAIQHGVDMGMMADQNQKTRFENEQGGCRLATSVDGSNTGEGGDKIIIDDANNVREGESEVSREGVNEWFDEVMSTRLNDPTEGALVAIQQRTHTHDLSGHILEQDREVGEWTFLCLPMRYEGENRVRNSPLGFADPRTKEGELLCPDRFTEEAVARLERSLGSYATAGQLQQRPAPRTGGLVKASLIHVVQVAHVGRVVRAVRYWDNAATEGAGCYSAGVLMYLMESGRFVIADVKMGQWSVGHREQERRQTAELDRARLGDKVEIWIELEGGSGGPESVNASIRLLAGFKVYADRVSGQGNKEERMVPFAVQVEAENVDVLAGEWVQGYLDRLALFPRAKPKDDADATSGGFNVLTRVSKDSQSAGEAGVWGR